MNPAPTPHCDWCDDVMDTPLLPVCVDSPSGLHEHGSGSAPLVEEGDKLIITISGTMSNPWPTEVLGPREDWHVAHPISVEDVEDYGDEGVVRTTDGQLLRIVPPR
jgi:hypothetical protein